MGLHPLFGARLVIDVLTRPAMKPSGNSAAANKKNMNSNKQVQGKYGALARIIGESLDQGQQLDRGSYDQSMQFSVTGV